MEAPLRVDVPPPAPVFSSAGDGPVLCAHCATIVPRSRVVAEGPSFCCAGCDTVYHAIRRYGLDRYYDVARTVEAAPVRARVPDGRFDAFDDPAFEALYVTAEADGTRSVELYLENVHCAACVWLVEKAPLVVPGTVEAVLDVGRSLAHVRFRPDETKLSTIAAFLASVGYPPHPYRGVAARDMQRREDRALLWRIGLSGAVAGNVMLLAISLYAAMFEGIEEGHRQLLRWASLVVTIPALLYGGDYFFRNAWGALRNRGLHIDLPICLGIVAGLAVSFVNTIRGDGEIFFDTVTALIFFLLLGRFAQVRRQRAAAEAAELLYALTPTTARRVTPDGRLETVSVAALGRGDTVEVASGDTIPADGVVTAGDGDLDVSVLTGESRPVPAVPGAAVAAGAVVTGPALRVQVTATGAETRVGRLMALVAAAARRRAPIVRFADRAAVYFTAGMIIASAGVFAGWTLAGSPHALEHAMALLVVTCPCALGIGTPLTVGVAVGRAAKRGLLIKGGDALEALAAPRAVVLDKTGTVTDGRLALVRYTGDPQALRLAAALEAGLAHPVARALCAAVPDAPDAPVTAVQRSGRGVEGRVGEHALRVGTPMFAADGAALPADLAAALEAVDAAGETPAVIAVNGVPAGVASLADTPRPEAAATVRALRDAGAAVYLLSGDTPAAARRAAAAVGIDAENTVGGAAPEDKVAFVERLGAAGTVVMVGDGANDAAALKAATVGVGLHGGSEACMAAGDVFIAKGGVGAVADLVAGARRTLTIVHWSLGFSLFYNLIGAGLAGAGLLHPIVAAILMPVSSLTVVNAAFRFRSF